MSAALSLLDDEPELPRDSRQPQDPRDLGHPNPEALDPHVIRDRATMLRGLKPGGISVPILVTATLVASPALIQCLLRHSISFATMMERWVVITLGCWAISEAVRRYVGHIQKQAETNASSEDGDETSVSDASPTVLPIDTQSP